MGPLLVALLAMADPAGQPHILVADIALSEFTPALHLTLDVDTGRYDVALPDTWPAGLAKPAPRRGTLTGAKLEAVRTAYAAAEVAGLGKPGCPSESPTIHYPPPVYLPAPHVSIVHGAHRLAAPAYEECFTKEATKLHALVDSL